MKLLIDTNIYLDAMMDRAPWAEAAKNLLIAVAEERAAGCISASSFSDIYYILRKHLQDKEKARQALIGLVAAIDILDVSGIDCEKALNSPLPDIEDAILLYCGERHKVDYIVTRDIKHYKDSPIEIIEPDAVLKLL